ncbi:MAG: hypothetical protein QM535_11325 [Limnohabitans sp.]|nr:hypothetical protein [Limnohabitans sp.]
MKKLIVFLLVIFSNCIYAQFGVRSSENEYDVYVIKKSESNLYGEPVNYLRDAQLSGETQMELQRRYDYNFSRISNAINDLNFKITNLNCDRERKNRIINRFNSIIDYLKKNRINYTSNTQTTQTINYLYDSINTILREEY